MTAIDILRENYEVMKSDERALLNMVDFFTALNQIRYVVEYTDAHARVVKERHEVRAAIEFLESHGFE